MHSNSRGSAAFAKPTNSKPPVSSTVALLSAMGKEAGLTPQQIKGLTERARSTSSSNAFQLPAQAPALPSGGAYIPSKKPQPTTSTTRSGALRLAPSGPAAGIRTAAAIRAREDELQTSEDNSHARAMHKSSQPLPRFSEKERYQLQLEREAVCGEHAKRLPLAITTAPAGAGISTPSVRSTRGSKKTDLDSLFEQVQQEIADRNAFLDKMKVVGKHQQYAATITEEIRSRVEELKKLEALARDEEGTS